MLFCAVSGQTEGRTVGLKMMLFDSFQALLSVVFGISGGFSRSTWEKAMVLMSLSFSSARLL